MHAGNPSHRRARFVRKTVSLQERQMGANLRSWLEKTFVAALVCLATMLAPLTSFAQSSNASIVGKVTDESGSVLPGVTVTATSPTLQVPSVSAVTDVNGEYRISPLPIGTYTVTYELAGVEPVRFADVRLTVGFVARLNATLKIGTLTETVTVSGVSPIVDTVSTAATTQL